MRGFWCRLLLLSVLIMPQRAWATPSSEAIAESRRLAQAQNYDAALSVLRKAENDYPGDYEVGLAIARVLSWRGDYDGAEQQLDSLGQVAAADADARLMRANLAYYRGDLVAAQAAYEAILYTHPDYADAQAGLARVKAAQAAEAMRSKWSLDAGYERSEFSRRVQPDWSQGFIQVTRNLRDHSALYGRVVHYNQFDRRDTEIEIGGSRRLGPRLNAYLALGATPDADFRPDYRIAAGTSVRVSAQDMLPVWLLLDARHDDYNSVSVTSLGVGLRVEPVDGWAVSARSLTVDQGKGASTGGYDIRIDGQLPARWGFYAGYADAPETVAGITVDTRSTFGGLSRELGGDMLVRLGYARDDRENAYVRRALNVSFTRRY